MAKKKVTPQMERFTSALYNALGVGHKNAQTRKELCKRLHGIEDIPDEHKVFAFPQLTVREQMAAYKEIIDGSSLEGYRKIAKKEHEER